jgi:bacillithiol biosynthesis cysteine-adding enzyme BshC
VTTGIYEVYRDGGAGAFFRDHFADADARARAVRRATRPLDAAVAAAIEEQNARYAPSAARDENIRLLRHGAAAVVTGQQVGLFLGPLYNFYKAASAIRAARELAASTASAVVPVFWLQTEDHDLPEIAVCNVPRADGSTLRLELPASQEDRVALAHVELPPLVEDRLDQIREELAHFPHAARHLETLARHYRSGARWCDAYGGALAELFAGEGLVLVDPRVPALAAIAAPLHRRAIENAAPIAEALSQRCGELAAAGFTPAVHVRPGAPLSFYHPEGPAGPRFRLEPEGGAWREVGGSRSHGTGELLADLERQPLACSTSVLLRPILQDTLLPTAAYVGGPGEIAYFAQLAPLYDAFEMTMPVIVPRASFRIVEDKTRHLLERLGADASCAALAENEILGGGAAAENCRSRGEAIRRDLTDSFAAALLCCGDLAGAGPGMTSAVDKARRAVAHAADRLAAKYETALLHQRQDLVEAARRVKCILQPEGVPQERFYGLSYFAARYGEREMVERILDGVEPFDPTTRDLCCSGEV